MEGLYPRFKKGRLGHFTHKCGGIKYAPDISLFLLSKRWDHFAPLHTRWVSKLISKPKYVYR